MSLAKARPERLSTFSGGVFAVLITILVLELRPPHEATFSALGALWPTWLSYAVSYLFVAIVWTNHHFLLRERGEVAPHLVQLRASVRRVARAVFDGVDGRERAGI